MRNFMIMTALVFALAMPAATHAAHGGHVVISEIQIGGESAKDEYVELFNPTDAAVDLIGWRLAKRTASGNESNLLTTFPALTIAAHASIAIAHPEGAFAANASALYSTSGSIAADNTLVLYAPLADGARSVVDLVGWGSAASFEGAGAAQNPETGKVLERKPGGDDHGQDTENNTGDFVIRGTTGDAEAPPPTPPQDEGEGQEDEQPQTSQPLVEPSVVAPPIVPKHVRINEFVSDPADGDVEWIELINTGAEAVNLTDWTVEDGAERRTVLSGALPSGGYFVIEEPAGKLNNGGDHIVLMQPDGTRIDAVSYGDWDDGNRADNAPMASDPASVARVVDGGDADNDARDWVRTETPTKGEPNVVASVPDAPTRTSAADTGPSRRVAIVVLNELYPDPLGDDSADEFIEIANIGDWGTTLDGWRLRDALGTEHVITPADGPTSLGAGAVLALLRSRTGIALNNTGGETVRLYKPDQDRATSVVEYRGAAPEGASYARTERGAWVWSTTVTSDTVNTITTPNRVPEAAIAAPSGAEPGTIVVFDGSDSADPDSERLTYLWNFGDPETEADVHAAVSGRYVYAHPGTYTITLTVTDERGGSARATHTLRIGQTNIPNDSNPASMRSNESVSPSVISSESASREISPPGWSASQHLRLSEILPDPAGRDADGEWVEIENTGESAVTLAGWEIVITGADARRSPLPDDATVPARGFLLIPRPQLRAALPNSGGTVELTAPGGAVVDSTAYGQAKEGWSWARLQAEEWQWTSAPSPGAPNAFVLGVRATPERTTTAQHGTFTVSLAELPDVPFNTDVVVRGTVTAAPGDAGAQVFYLGDAQHGVQIYIGKRAIPALAIGAEVEVFGEYRMASGEPRVGIRAPEDVRVLRAGAPPDPTPLRVADAADDRLGTLVVLEGEVMERRGSIIHVDDGSDEIRATLPSADADAAIREGDTVRIAGVLSKTTSGFRVLARTPDDVAVLERAQIQNTAALPAQRLRTSLEIGLLATAAGLLAIPALRRKRTRT
ncbi:MAG: lamin tail domain-containing protein [bacterium]|nr:lamin tail domain-containing protein [bacterium]